jgi:hypothetical protein
MEKGVVKATNHKRGMFIVQCDGGGFGVFELVSWVEIEPGDVLEWPKRVLGRTMLTNVSRAGNSIHVFAQNWDCTESIAILQIR